MKPLDKLICVKPYFIPEEKNEKYTIHEINIKEGDIFAIIQIVNTESPLYGIYKRFIISNGNCILSFYDMDVEFKRSIYYHFMTLAEFTANLRDKRIDEILGNE